MLGISTYFQDLDFKYLERASEIGAKYLFTSLHIPEEDLSNLEEKLPNFLDKVRDYNLSLVPDISPKTFKKLGVDEGDYQALKEMEFKALRLDYGFEDYELVRELQENFELILNASVVTKKDLLEAEEAGVDLEKISVMHNFYPKTGTGLPVHSFKKLNKTFEEMNIKTMAFVVGDKLKRFPLYEGLPTLEKHRTVHPYVAAVELIEEFGIQDILIGDSEAEFKTLEWIEAYRKDRVMHIPAYFEKKHEAMYKKPFKVRRDSSEAMVRLSGERQTGIPVTKNNIQHYGSITMENRLAGRYSGEIYINKVNNQFSPRSNVLGFVHPDFLGLIPFIDRNIEIKFIPY